MAERSETRKLPRGERCTQCGDRRYYLENGLRFCASNGHEIEVSTYTMLCREAFAMDPQKEGSMLNVHLGLRSI
jgi:hypothetical protein